MTSGFSVWHFQTADGADHAISMLHQLPAHESLQDGAIVSWPEHSLRPFASQISASPLVAPLTGAFWGVMMAVVFLLPMIAGLDAPAGVTGERARGDVGDDGGHDSLLERFGFDATFVATLRRGIVRGSSALLLLTEPGPPTSYGFGAGASQLVLVLLTSEHIRELRARF